MTAIAYSTAETPQELLAALNSAIMEGVREGDFAEVRVSNRAIEWHAGWGEIDFALAESIAFPVYVEFTLEHWPDWSRQTIVWRVTIVKPARPRLIVWAGVDDE